MKFQKILTPESQPTTTVSAVLGVVPIGVCVLGIYVCGYLCDTCVSICGFLRWF